jgi:hypothetical protein
LPKIAPEKQKTRWAFVPAGDENLVLANLLYTPHQARRCAVMMMVAMDSRIHLQKQNREGRAMCQHAGCRDCRETGVEAALRGRKADPSLRLISCGASLDDGWVGETVNW